MDLIALSIFICQMKSSCGPEWCRFYYGEHKSDTQWQFPKEGSLLCVTPLTSCMSWMRAGGSGGLSGEAGYCFYCFDTSASPDTMTLIPIPEHYFLWYIRKKEIIHWNCQVIYMNSQRCTLSTHKPATKALSFFCVCVCSFFINHWLWILSCYRQFALSLAEKVDHCPPKD